MPRPPAMSEAAVRYLRKRYADRKIPGRRNSGIPDRVLVECLGVTRTALWQAATGLTYKRLRS